MDKNDRFERLRRMARRVSTEDAIDAIARAEAEHPDLLEEEAVIEETPPSHPPEE